MRLLVVTTSYPTVAYGSSGIFVQRLLHRLPNAIHIKVLSPADDRSGPPIDSPVNISVKSFRYGPRRHQQLAHRPGGLPVSLHQNPRGWLLVPFFCLSMFIAALRLARSADVIHANWLVSGVIAGVVGRVVRVPVVVTLRGADMAWAARSWWGRWLLKHTFRNSYAIVGVSYAMAEQLRVWFGEHGRSVRVISNGVEAVDPNPKGSIKGFTKGSNDQHDEVVVVGSLIPRKRIDQVIRAVAALAGIQHDIRLRVVGDGPEKSALQTLAYHLGIGDRVVFVGQVAPDRVIDHLLGCRALVLASTSEGRPNVVLEAMAAGVPVVAADIDGVREMVVHGETGLLFNAQAHDQLVEHLKALLSDRQLGRALTENARRWLVSSQVTWEKAATDYTELFRQAIASQHRRR